jgi:hypothetical protein
VLGAHAQLRPIGRVMLGALAGGAGTAVTVRLLAAAQARHVIAYRFPTGTLGWPGVGQIFASNARLALAPLAAAYLVDVVRPPDGMWVGWRRLARWGCDGVLAAAALTNVFIAGASYGAYGLEMVRYTMPHAPLELAAFACPLALYLEARRATPSRRRVLSLCCASGLLLGVAALTEGLLPPL